MRNLLTPAPALLCLQKCPFISSISLFIWEVWINIEGHCLGPTSVGIRAQKDSCVVMSSLVLASKSSSFIFFSPASANETQRTSWTSVILLSFKWHCLLSTYSKGHTCPPVSGVQHCSSGCGLQCTCHRRIQNQKAYKDSVDITVYIRWSLSWIKWHWREKMLRSVSLALR